MIFGNWPSALMGDAEQNDRAEEAEIRRMTVHSEGPVQLNVRPGSFASVKGKGAFRCYHRRTWSTGFSRDLGSLAVSNRSLPNSNRVSALPTRILKIVDLRLARETRWPWPKIKKIAPQRLRDVLLSRGIVASILVVMTCRQKTGLAGWPYRTRTRKCRCKLSL
jgi:hypothetical protein